MKSFERHIASIIVLALATCACAVAGTSREADPNEADKAAIHAEIKRWVAASQAKDVEEFVSVHAAHAVVMLEGAPDLRGLEVIREGIGGMMQDPHFSLSFEADEVVVARAGDMAYESGTYSLSISDPDGNPASQHGHYVVVWQKQADGRWKVVRRSGFRPPGYGGSGLKKLRSG